MDFLNTALGLQPYHGARTLQDLASDARVFLECSLASSIVGSVGLLQAICLRDDLSHKFRVHHHLLLRPHAQTKRFLQDDRSWKMEHPILYNQFKVWGLNISGSGRLAFETRLALEICSWFHPGRHDTLFWTALKLVLRRFGLRMRVGMLCWVQHSNMPQLD
jgi:hypothetical protein